MFTGTLGVPSLMITYIATAINYFLLLSFPFKDWHLRKMLRKRLLTVKLHILHIVWSLAVFKEKLTKVFTLNGLANQDRESSVRAERGEAAYLLIYPWMQNDMNNLRRYYEC